MTDLDALIREREASRHRPIPPIPALPISPEELADLLCEMRPDDAADGLTSNERRSLERAQYRADVLADLELLWGSDSVANIAARVGRGYKSPKVLARVLARWGEHRWAAMVHGAAKAQG